MIRVAQLDKEDRADLFRIAAADSQTGIRPAFLEKDFWVCYTLDALFNRSPFKDRIAFKGGTSLSKCFGVIDRFSEDIDLILDWRVLGYGALEP